MKTIKSKRYLKLEEDVNAREESMRGSVAITLCSPTNGVICVNVEYGLFELVNSNNLDTVRVTVSENNDSLEYIDTYECVDEFRSDTLSNHLNDLLKDRYNLRLRRKIYDVLQQSAFVIHHMRKQL